MFSKGSPRRDLNWAARLRLATWTSSFPSRSDAEVFAIVWSTAGRAHARPLPVTAFLELPAHGWQAQRSRSFSGRLLVKSGIFGRL